MKFFLLTLTATACMAVPVMNPDGVRLDPNDPGIGKHCRVIFNSFCDMYANDNIPGSISDDYDGNDDRAFARIFGDGSGFAIWRPGVSAWVNWWVIAGQVVDWNHSASWGPMDPNTILTVTAMTQGGQIYSSGHENVMIYQTTQTPEPGTWALMGAGLVALGFLRRRR